jgi:hypothetical protein
MLKRPRPKAAGIAIGVLASLGLMTMPASSAGDTTVPVLTAPVKGAFVTGSQLGLGEVCNASNPNDLRLYAPLRLRWSASDDSGSVAYTLTEWNGSLGPYDVISNGAQTSYRTHSTNHNQCWGGPKESAYEWSLEAKDPSGNSVTHTMYGGQIRLTQENGGTDDAGFATVPKITYAGAWGTSYCKCWLAGAVRRTTTQGATATIAPAATSFPGDVDNHHVALVAEKGPDRGKFRIYVDGRLRTTVDLYAATSRPRTIVWQTGFGDHGHTIKVENLATPGRPRIDLDAVLTN